MRRNNLRFLPGLLALTCSSDLPIMRRNRGGTPPAQYGKSNDCAKKRKRKAK